MQLKPFKEYLTMTKEAINVAMAPIRAAKVQAKAALKVAELDAEILNAQVSLEELVGKEDIDFAVLACKLDNIEILERRKEQLNEILSQLFPTTLDK